MYVRLENITNDIYCATPIIFRNINNSEKAIHFTSAIDTRLRHVFWKRLKALRYEYVASDYVQRKRLEWIRDE